MHSMKRLLRFFTFCLMTGSVFPAELTFYVAPDGMDRWSGRLPSPSANKGDGPLATLSAAVKRARAARQNAARDGGGISILLRSGVYELAEPLVLGPEDSGTSATQPFTIAALPGEKPVISGGRRLTNWKRLEGKAGLWQTDVPMLSEGKWLFRSVFIDGQRKQRARTPNEGFFRIQGDTPQDKPLKLKFSPGDIKKEWADDGEVEVIALLAWSDVR